MCTYSGSYLKTSLLTSLDHPQHRYDTPPPPDDPPYRGDWDGSEPPSRERSISPTYWQALLDEFTPSEESEDPMMVDGPADHQGSNNQHASPQPCALPDRDEDIVEVPTAPPKLTISIRPSRSGSGSPRKRGGAPSAASSRAKAALLATPTRSSARLAAKAHESPAPALNDSPKARGKRPAQARRGRGANAYSPVKSSPLRNTAFRAGMDSVDCPSQAFSDIASARVTSSLNTDRTEDGDIILSDDSSDSDSGSDSDSDSG